MRLPLVSIAFVVLFCGVFAAGLSASTAASGTAARERCRLLRLQLREERARLIREDPEATRLSREIVRLLRELDAVLAARPSIRALAAELDAAERDADVGGGGPNGD